MLQPVKTSNLRRASMLCVAPRLWRLSSLVAVVLGFHVLARAADMSADCGASALPEQVRRFLHEEFANWTIQEPRHLSSEARATWAARRPLECPGVATGRFDDINESAYAFLLVSIDPQKSAFKLVVCAASKGQPYRARVVDQQCFWSRMDKKASRASDRRYSTRGLGSN